MISRCTGGNRFSVFGLLMLVSLLTHSSISWAQETGEQIFQANCSACHLIGGGRLVGPDLAGVLDRHAEAWLHKFIQSSQALVKGGDVEAVAKFKEFNGIIMPDFPLSDAQITQLLNYIGVGGSAPAAVADASQVAPAATPAPVSMEQVIRGQELFQGKTRLKNRGPSCNACHDVRNDAVIGGGVLARELTTVFSRMGDSGVKAILGQAPFPVMQAAYKGRALTKPEITSLVAFLQNADKEHLFHQPRDYGLGLFVSGAVGAGIMYLLFAIIWRGRKRGSVNQEIYDRQIKSGSDNTHQ